MGVPARRTKAILLLFSVVLTLGLLEIGLRITGLPAPASDACWRPTDTFIRPEPDPELGWVYLPGSVIGPATVNERGLRGPVLPERKAAGAYRVLFIGDSTTFGLGVPLEESFAALAAAGIGQDRPGQAVEFEIGALPGYSSHHSLVMTRRMLAHEPDLVVFYVGGHNDHSRARYYHDGEIPERLARREAGWHAIPTLRLFELVADRFYRSLGRKLLSPGPRSRVPPDAFEANMLEMVELTQAAGAVPVVLSPPFSEHLRKRHPAIPQFEAALVSVAEQTGVPLVELQEPFGRHPDDEVFFPDGFHFNPAGHRLAAEQIRSAAKLADAADPAATPPPTR
jgi:lysophospholipase L1-like esterase